MRVLVTGSCAWKDKEAVYERLSKLSSNTTIIHGCSMGVDTFAGSAAKRLGFKVEEFPPDYEIYGKQASAKRNIAMTEAEPDICIAFWNGKSHGTFHTMYEAIIRNIPVDVVMEKTQVKQLAFQV